MLAILKITRALKLLCSKTNKKLKLKNSLHIDSVQLRFDNKIILSDVFLSCETGDIVAVFGRNGCGKSSLLKIIYGTIQPQYSFLKINNQVIQNRTDLRKVISYLPQKQFIPNNFLVSKVISLMMNKNEIANFCDDALLKPILNTVIKNLSGGELKYLEVKLILNANSQFCILDEPYSGISPVMIEKINELILSKSLQKGIIVTDHDYQNMLSIATKLYFIKNQRGHFIPNKQALVENGYLTAEML